jgi:drug/metabolite transporter (DMT)-like permease
LHSASFEAGLLVLLAAQLLSSYMGIYVQNMYATYGSHWQENLFYSHLLSIPMVLPFHGSMQTQYQRLLVSPPVTTSSLSSLPLSPAIEKLVLQALAYLPNSIMHLLINGATQCLCITGVNLLGSRSSAVTVTIVLNVRKLVSFMLSIWLFGNPLSPMMLVGAGVVFGSGALYGWESAMQRGGGSKKIAEGDKNKSKPLKEAHSQSKSIVNEKSVR